MDEARTFGYEDIVKFFENAKQEESSAEANSDSGSDSTNIVQ